MGRSCSPHQRAACGPDRACLPACPAVSAAAAASLILGGLASGASIQQVTLPAILVFLAVLHREVLMDIDDVEGEEAADTLAYQYSFS